MILVGNKSDLNDKRAIPTEEGEEFAKRFDMKFYETSAFNGSNIEQLFLESSEDIIDKIEQDYYDLTDEESGIKVGAGIKKSALKKNESTKPKKKCSC